MFPPIDQITTDGYDLQFGTNVLGHAILTIQLLPALIAGGESSPDGKARVVNTSSFAAYLADGKIDFRGSKDLKVRKKLGRTGLYNQSKLVNSLAVCRWILDKLTVLRYSLYRGMPFSPMS